MKALLVIDVQNGIVDLADFSKELSIIETTIQEFQSKGQPVLFLKHVVDEPKNPLYKESTGSELHPSLSSYAATVIEKSTPSAFLGTSLSEKLDELNVDHVFITGFNAEYCPQFTAIAAYDRGYKVTVLEEAIGTVNNEETYEMPGLDIKDFVSTVLHWSNVIEVLDHEEYLELYSAE